MDADSNNMEIEREKFMQHYFVDEKMKQAGVHEVHRDGCSEIPAILYRKYLGYFPSSQDAVKKAKTFYKNVDKCDVCCGNRTAGH